MKPKHRAKTTKIHTGCTSECTIPHIPPEHVPSVKLLPQAALLVPHGCIPWLSSFREQGVERVPLASGVHWPHLPARQSWAFLGEEELAQGFFPSPAAAEGLTRVSSSPAALA